MVWAPEALFGRHLPLVILTGFLGSGKTTLLNRLLADPRMAGTAILVNEFGSVPVDHSLIEAPAGEVVALANGCMCCLAQDDLHEALLRVFAAERPGAPFRRVVIETSGLADPEAVVQSVTGDPVLNRFLWLDRLIVTADAQYVQDQCATHPEAAQQIRLADRLVLTKTDLVPPGDLPGVHAAMQALNPWAELSEGIPDLSALLSPGFLTPEDAASPVGGWVARQPELGGHGAGRRGEPPPADCGCGARDCGHPGGWRGEPRPTEGGCDGDRQHEPHPADYGGQGAHAAAERQPHAHGPQVRAVVLETDQPLDWRRFHLWLTAQQRRLGRSLLRVKGLVRVGGTGNPVVIHAVRTTLHVPVELTAWPEGPHHTRLVFILTGEDGTRLEQDWQEHLRAMAAA